MKVLIIGGTGSISSYVAEKLAARGDEVTIASRGNNNIASTYKFIQADRDNPDQYKEALRQWRGDVAIDFICFRPEHAQNSYEALRGRVQQFLFVSSAAVYDKSSLTSIPLTEESAHGGRNWEYARRKSECEAFFMGKFKEEAFPITIVRPSHTLGLGKIPTPLGSRGWTVASRILKGQPIVVPGDGQTLWTVTASWDFAIGMAGLVGLIDAVGEAFHITHDSVLTWNAILHELAWALGKQPQFAYMPLERICELEPQQTGNLKDDKALHTIFDNSKIKRFVPGFHCATSFREFIRRTVAWYAEDESRKVLDEGEDDINNRLLAALKS